MSRCLIVILALLGLAAPAGADRVELQGEAALVGRVLAEKPDHLVVDVGYTVLMVPRSQVVAVAATSEAAAPPVGMKTLPVQTNDRAASGFYSTRGDNAMPRSVRELVSLLGEGVVQVRTPGGLGSGFLINEEGFLITNFHVIQGETQISVEVYWQKNGQLERKTYKTVKIVAMNKFKDLALLKIEEEDAPPFKFVNLGDADELDVGERVFAIGSPLGLERTVTEGIVSTKTREMMGELYLQTTAQINPGNSGGPLFNLKGEVVGVTNMKIDFGEGLGFAIPVEALRFFLKHRDAYAYSTDNPSNPFRYLEPPNRTRHQETLER
jgi:serine protease Do